MNVSDNLLYKRLKSHTLSFHKIVPFDPHKHKLFFFDFTDDNKELEQIDLANTQKFIEYIDKTLKKAKANYGIGGYNENRIVYKRSELFKASPNPSERGALLPHKADTKNLRSHQHPHQSALSDGKVSPFGGDLEGARSVHLGIDIWGTEGTKVYAPLGGMVHSFAFNNNFGDYGATIILLHQLDGFPFYTLYGHLNLKDIAHLKEGKYFSRGEVIGHFGKPEENGHWPPHLHFQIINDIRMYRGDYPGVCSVNERKKYLANCPDPDVILGMMEFAK